MLKLPGTSENVEDILSLVFSQISLLCFDKARELVEKEKDSSSPGPYRVLLTQLPNLVVVEKSYVELGFVSAKNKIFLRKDNSLKCMYETLRQDLHKLEECSDFTVSLMAGKICQYLTIRIQLIDVYEKMYSMGPSNKPIRCEEVLAQVEAILYTSFTAQLDSPSVKATCSQECEILMYLLRALVDVQHCHFFPSLMNLHGAHSRLSTWEKTLQNRESWKLGFGASFLKGNPLPALVQWLGKLKTAIVSKFTLYFHNTLVQQTAPQEMRAICSKHNMDYFHKLQTLQRRYDATTVMIVFEASGLTEWCGPGYKHPDRAQDPLETFYIMVHYPLKLTEQLPTLGKAITERAVELAMMDKIIFCYSIKDHSTYFLSSLDPRVTLVVVFDSKKDEKETSLCKFINEFSAQLRFNKVFSYLKLNTK